MDTFHAMFWDTKVFVNQRYQYLNNEILVQYLNMDAGGFEQLYSDLQECMRRVTLKLDMSEEYAQRQYDDHIQNTQELLTRIDNLFLSLPPYKEYMAGYQAQEQRLIACLNRYPYLFEDGAHDDPYSVGPAYPEHNKFGYLTSNSYGESVFWLTHFDPTPMVERMEDGEDDGDVFVTIKQANEEMQSTISTYLRWLEDVMRVKKVYAKLLEEYVHIRHGFLSEHELAVQMDKYLKTELRGSRSYLRLGASKPQAVAYEVFRPETGQAILCDSYDFNSIGAFLYTDFFKGLRNNHIPRKCGNCGKWFLLPHGKYSDYCENSLEGDPSKTCRSASSRKKYDEKCRTDPIWQAYNRAYKAHYARYMKKKMTNAEFEKWGVYAIELREKATAGDMAFEEYEKLLKV